MKVILLTIVIFLFSVVPARADEFTCEPLTAADTILVKNETDKIGRGRVGAHDPATLTTTEFGRSVLEPGEQDEYPAGLYIQAGAQMCAVIYTNMPTHPTTLTMSVIRGNIVPSRYFLPVARTPICYGWNLDPMGCPGYGPLDK